MRTPGIVPDRQARRAVLVDCLRRVVASPKAAEVATARQLPAPQRFGFAASSCLTGACHLLAAVAAAGGAFKLPTVATCSALLITSAGGLLYIMEGDTPVAQGYHRAYFYLV
mmetsp:Transcript_11878/g.27685  ORF Transcript_11878/g.27685 Transcript_11878/m.27685 type:complete len:112 (-) Transcript_11878:16-351(-)